jgi:hypothetical protein
MEVIMSKSKPITPGTAIFYGGLIAGMLDVVDGVVVYYVAVGFNPIQVLQFIARGFYGALFKKEFSAPFQAVDAGGDFSLNLFMPLTRRYPASREDVHTAIFLETTEGSTLRR